MDICDGFISRHIQRHIQVKVKPIYWEILSVLMHAN